jgi:hypothetical protein
MLAADRHFVARLPGGMRMSSLISKSSAWAVVSCAIVIPAATARAQDARPPTDYLHASPADLQWFRNARFGLFVCWGPVSLKGTEIGWSRGGERRGLKGTGNIPVEVYDNLYKLWKPDKFDARQWVKVAQDAGMKYMIFLVRHHDGFSLYDTKLSDYKSTSPEAAWQHDVMADIAAACHQAGLKLFIYYSQPDWHHPDYRTANHDRYLRYLHGQIRELLTNYGRIDGLWFDGLGGTAKDWDAENLFKLIRTLQPHILINNRCGLPGDFDTPEQKIGKFQTNRPWESCITLGTQWSWKPEDKIKSLKECIHILVRCAGGDGNLALNTNPMPDGQIEPRQVDRLKEIGEWLSKYGRSIYGTRGGPFPPGPWGACTCSGNTVYVHVLEWKGDPVSLPALPGKVVSSSVLTGGRADVKQTETGTEITVPAAERQDIDTIVALQLDKPAGRVSNEPGPDQQATVFIPWSRAGGHSFPPIYRCRASRWLAFWTTGLAEASTWAARVQVCRADFVSPIRKSTSPRSSHVWASRLFLDSTFCSSSRAWAYRFCVACTRAAPRKAGS